MKTLFKNSVAVLILLFVSYTSFSQTDTTNTRSTTSQEFDRNADIDIERQDELDRDRQRDDARDINRDTRDTRDWNQDADNTRRDVDNTRDRSLSRDADAAIRSDRDDRYDDREDLRNERTDMVENINEVELTGNYDADFAKIMIEHHKGAVDIADKFLGKTENDQLKEIAEESRDKKKADIQIMEDLLDNMDVDNNRDNASRVDSPLKNSLTTNMNSSKSASMSGDIDSDFTQMMIEHHKQAIELSKMEVENGTNSDLKAMAKKIIEDNEKQITKLKEHKGKSMKNMDSKMDKSDYKDKSDNKMDNQ